jgi:hypothetical protein
VLVCDIDIIILDAFYSIDLGLDVKDGYLRWRLKPEELLDRSMTEGAAASNHESRSDLGRAAGHDGDDGSGGL